MKKIFILIFVTILCSCHRLTPDIESFYYSKLDKIRDNKKSELIEYMEMIERTISSVENDGPLIDSFELLNLAYTAYTNKKKTTKVNKSLEEIDSIIQNSYLDRFMIFDNILFINREGDVFYSLKKRAPLLENIFKSEYQRSKLSKSLLQDPLTTAVDFGSFSHEEPSAFFVYPVVKDKNHLGWCAFQFSSSRLETLFSKESELGRTGEVFMVNEDSYMLTESSFSPEASVLKLHLSDENISSKFSEGIGHKKIIDYRGHEAITSFEVISIYDLKWLLISKIDLDEVITQDFKVRKDEYYEIIRKESLEREQDFVKELKTVDYSNEVNLDQFKRVSETGKLYTHGVSTCTAVIITLPGKFSYFAHISAYDSLYGGNNTDLIGNMFNRIRKYEIPDYLLRELKVYVITPQIKFTQNIIEKFVEEGVFLSQVYLIKNKNASYANVYHDLASGEIFVDWKMKNSENLIEDLTDANDIGKIAGHQYGNNF